METASKSLHKSILENRKANFKVEIRPEPYPDEDGAIELRTTRNGYQFTAMSLLQSEIPQVIEALEAAIIS